MAKTLLRKATIGTFLVGVAVVTAMFFGVNRLPAFDVIEGEYLRMVASADEAATLADRYGLELVAVSDHGLATFTESSDDSGNLIAAGFSYNGRSTAIGRVTDSDPYLDDQYGLELTHVIEAWEVTTGSAGVTVAIIDTGIDIDHVEFAGRISPLSYNSVTDVAGLANVVDDVGHGTMVAGVIGAIKGNRIGIAGIAQNVVLLVIKANIADDGSFTDASIIEGIYYAVDHGADVINLSLGGGYANPNTKTAVEYAVDHGVTVIAAAGNDGTDDLFYPASFEVVVSVSAVGPDGILADYSNYNPAIDLAAPGSDIVTTTPNDGYAIVDGTSFASPCVAGIVALLLSAEPGLSVPEIRTRLAATATDRGLVGIDDFYGSGIVDADSLLSTVFHEVTFESNGGTAIDPVWVEDGRYLLLPLPPSRADMIFIGWYLDAGLSVPWVRGVPVTADLALYASYSDSHHTVTFHSDGTVPAPIVVAHGETFVVPATTLPGSRFVDWYIDSQFVTAYAGETVTADLSLFAKFAAIVYYDVTLIVLGATDAVLTFEENTVVAPTDAVSEGYLFSGWHLDPECTIPYSEGPLLADVTLYAKMERIVFQVTLLAGADPLDSVFVAYGDVPILTDPVLPEMDFAGWFIDEALEVPYVETQVYADFTLYAKFIPLAFAMTVFIGDTTEILYYEPGAIPAPTVPEIPGTLFDGWYLDDGYATAYVSGPIVADLSIYAKIDAIAYTVRFFAADGTTVIATETVGYGASVTPPDAPVRTATVCLSFDFIGWSLPTDDVKSDLDVIPRYEVVFDPATISLRPGIDTVDQGASWTDSGVECPDPELAIVVVGSVSAGVGRYVLEYRFMYEEIVRYRLFRVVNVLEATDAVLLVLKKGLTTIPVGGTYLEAGATTNHGEVVVSGTVDATTAGIYTIIYSVEWNGTVVERTRYVFVVAMDETVPLVMLPVWRKEEDHA
ncbi:MAG TPA: hypothetical protein DCR44_02285 [Acholeplasmatales bacterium]|nr:MAG: hypothetical protein A2Y16_01710 [Tenericutes bacterium GWF2_57_13]HAQ56220.1 hypothetical protein [Acholeplasmatales bacterium]